MLKLKIESQLLNFIEAVCENTYSLYLKSFLACIKTIFAVCKYSKFQINEIKAER